jgi:hypothetical protein
MIADACTPAANERPLRAMRTSISADRGERLRAERTGETRHRFIGKSPSTSGPTVDGLPAGAERDGKRVTGLTLCGVRR